MNVGKNIILNLLLKKILIIYTQNKAINNEKKDKDLSSEKSEKENKEKIEKENYEKAAETYNTLKKYLISTCIKIEENFNKIYSVPAKENKSISQLQNKNEEEDKENEEIIKKIKILKIIIRIKMRLMVLHIFLY